MIANFKISEFKMAKILKSTQWVQILVSSKLYLIIIATVYCDVRQFWKRVEESSTMLKRVRNLVVISTNLEKLLESKSYMVFQFSKRSAVIDLCSWTTWRQ